MAFQIKLILGFIQILLFSPRVGIEFRMLIEYVIYVYSGFPLADTLSKTSFNKGGGRQAGGFFSLG